METFATELNDPITVMVSYHIKPDQEDAFKQWISGITQTAATFKGHQGVKVTRG